MLLSIESNKIPIDVPNNRPMPISFIRMLNSNPREMPVARLIQSISVLFLMWSIDFFISAFKYKNSFIRTSD